MSEETPTKKEEEFFGMPLSKIGVPALGVGLLALGLGAYQLLKPQIDQMGNDMRNRQAYAQQQQLAAAQAQQQQLQLQHQHQQDAYNGNQPQEGQQGMQGQQEQTQPQGVDPSVAIEQDPFARQRRVRIPEVEADSSGTSRFNNISI